MQPVNKAMVRTEVSGWGQSELGLNPRWSRVVLNKVRLWEPGWEFGTSGWSYAHSELRAGPSATCLSVNPTATSRKNHRDVISKIPVGKFCWHQSLESDNNTYLQREKR